MLLGVSRSPNAGGVAGTNGGSFSAGPVHAVDLPQRRQVEQPGHLDDVAGMDVELAQQQLEHVLGHVVGDLEPHRGAEPPARQFALERLQQVLVAVLFDLEVGVAGDAERVMLDDLQAGEQHRQERRDQFLHRQEPAPTSPSSRLSQLDEAVDVVGHLDSGEVLAAVLGLLHGDRQVQAQPADERERVGGVDGQRRQHREHLLVEVGRQSVALGVVEIGPRDDEDALLGQRRAHRIQEHVACLLAICWVRSPMRRSCSRGDRPSAERTDRPISSRRLRPATRTM